MAYSSLYARFYDYLQKTARSFRSVIKFVSAKYYLGAILLLQGLAWFQAINIFRKFTGNFLILHYNIDFGIDLVGDSYKIFYIPLAGFLVFLLNLIVSAIFVRKAAYKVLLNLLFSASVVFNSFINITLFAIYLINF